MLDKELVDGHTLFFLVGNLWHTGKKSLTAIWQAFYLIPPLRKI